MTARRSPYDGSAIVFATMHDKQRLADDSFAELLGATVVAPEHLDTDQFGTFAGDIPRTLSPYHAALVKARLAMQISGVPFALASEGSFTSLLGLGVENTELLLFIDSERGLELVESSTMDWPLPPGGTVHSAAEAGTRSTPASAMAITCAASHTSEPSISIHATSGALTVGSMFKPPP